MSKTSSNSIGLGAGIGFGLIIGLITAFLYSPLSGGQARQKLASLAKEVADSCEEIAEDIALLVEKAIDKTESAISEGDERLRRKIDKFRDDLEQLGVNEA